MFPKFCTQDHNGVGSRRVDFLVEEKISVAIKALTKLDASDGGMTGIENDNPSRISYISDSSRFRQWEKVTLW